MPALVCDTLFSHFCLKPKLRKFRINILARELLVATRKSFTLAFHVVQLHLIQMNLYELAILHVHVDSLAHNFTWENQGLQDCVVHGHESEAPGDIVACLLACLFVRLFVCLFYSFLELA